MLFCACRAADLMNAFVGLWLVPKYVDPSELGAVQPLTQFAEFLAIPIAAFANTFRNELTRLSINKEFGKLKTLMRGVFVATAVFLFLAIILAHFLLPAFLERIRIVEGSLGLVIIAASFVGAVAPIYSNALQALKKFKAQSILSIFGAPVRLIAMLVAMPFRAITGYFVGQTSVSVFTISASVISLNKELSGKAEPYWNRDVCRKYITIFAIFAMWSLSVRGYTLTESTILRQRLPDIDSAGYYIATRFSEIASFLAATLSFTIFPFSAYQAANNVDTRPLILKALFANAAFCMLIALPFLIFGRQILFLVPNGVQYAQFWWAIPWLIMLTWLSSIFGFFSTAEVAANRFGFLKWAVPLDSVYATILILITGHGYFTGFIPASWSEYLSAHNIYSLQTMLWWMTAFNIIKTMFCIAAMARVHIRKAYQ